MSKKNLLFLAVLYAGVTFILDTLLQTATGQFMMTLSFLAFILAVIGATYSLVTFFFKAFTYNQNRTKNHWWSLRRINSSTWNKHDAFIAPLLTCQKRLDYVSSRFNDFRKAWTFNSINGWNDTQIGRLDRTKTIKRLIPAATPTSSRL